MRRVGVKVKVGLCGHRPRNRGEGRKTTINNEAIKGRISGGNMFYDRNTQSSFIAQIRNQLDLDFGQTFSGKTKISIVKESSNIDVSPYLQVK